MNSKKRGKGVHRITEGKEKVLQEEKGQKGDEKGKTWL